MPSLFTEVADLTRLAKAGAAMALLGTDGARLMWTSPAGAQFFGISVGGNGSDHLDPQLWPVARFVQFAAGEAPVDGVRLERLTRPLGRSLQPTTLSVRRVALLVTIVALKGAPADPPTADDLVSVDSPSLAETSIPDKLLRFDWQTNRISH